MKTMNRIVALLMILQVSVFSAMAQTGSWHSYLSYYEPQQIVKGNNRLYVRASNSLYNYNLNDQSITTYDKIRQLSDNNIAQIAWNATVKKLIIVYNNHNIDLLDSNDEVFNISSYYSKAMTQDKTVNGIFVYQQFAYLLTKFGLVKIDMKRCEISESYILNMSVTNACIANDSIYIHNSDGVSHSAKLSTNLIDPHNWKVCATQPAELFVTSQPDWDQYIDLVKTLKPGGPKYNFFSYMKYVENTLVSANGGWKEGANFSRSGCVQLMENDNDWSFIENVTPYNNARFRDVTSFAYDPKDKSHFFYATCGSGLYEFRNGEMVMNYTQGNSPLVSALSPEKYPTSYQNYVRVDGLVIDNDGNLWMSCSSASTQKDNILKLNPTTGEWTTYNDPLLKYGGVILYILRRSILDSDGNIWIINDHSSHPCMLRINPSTEVFTRYDNFLNQDDSKVEIHYVRCVAQDLNGNIWMGTDAGLFMYDKTQQDDTSKGFTQVKIPRNDGTNLADYLLSNVDVTEITVDDANRKWIGTAGNGLYLISADNMEQLHHFTTDSSPILSNTIESVAISPETGEVYIGTDEGLCSYMSDATAPVDNMTKDNVYAFPNPVPSGYNGLITIRGLSFDADVKILTIDGRLVAQGRSNGGTFTWNGRDQQGRRVASGVYMIATATKDGKSGVVSKVAIVN